MNAPGLDLLLASLRTRGDDAAAAALAALLATKDGAFFKELATDPEQAKALAPTVSALQDFAERMRGIAELAECAAARVMVAGCNHESFNAWAAEEA